MSDSETPQSGAPGEVKAGPNGGDGPGGDVAARLQAHTRALHRDIRALQKALADVNAAIARSRVRLEQLRRCVPMRAPDTTATAARTAGNRGGERRDGDDRRSGGDRRGVEDSMVSLVRWVEALPMERRSGAERRTDDDRRQAPAATGSNAAGGAAAPPASSDVVSLAAFRARRGRRREPIS